MNTTPPHPPLRLVPVAGPSRDVIAIERGGAAVMGRSATCDRQLADASVSRRHASVSFQDDTWFVTDLHSRAGVLVNAAPIEPGVPTPVRDYDLVGIGPWTFRVRVGSESTMLSVSVTPDRLDPGERVVAVPERELGTFAKRRLDLLLECAGSINAAGDEGALAAAVLGAACEGTGFPRGAVIRPSDDEFLVLASVTPGGEVLKTSSFSRTLIDAAGEGQIARLSQDATPAHGESIARLGIEAAICAPIFLGNAIDSFLYLDDRRHSATVHHDAAAFCQALCRMGGMAMANLRRAALERFNEEIMRDVGAAAEAQRLLMPAPDGECEGLTYSVRARPGRFVAGDLFNILPLGGGRVGAYIGDVAGKGVGAAMLMASTQAMLNSALRSLGSPGEALGVVGPEIAPLLPGGKFISLWVAVIDPAGGTVDFVDAGHGHWMVVGPEGAHRPESVGGFPLGVDPDTTYADERLRLPEAGRLVLFSDGLVEQHSPAGEQFSAARIAGVLGADRRPREDVEALFDALVEHARSPTLDDDVTIASIGRRTQN